MTTPEVCSITGMTLACRIWTACASPSSAGLKASACAARRGPTITLYFCERTLESIKRGVPCCGMVSSSERQWWPAHD
eukprot:4184202-Prymnesium_polylepis.1